MKKKSTVEQLKEEEPMLTIKQTAAQLNTSEKTVRRRIDDGKIPVVRDGRIVRIRPKDLRAYVAIHRVE